MEVDVYVIFAFCLKIKKKKKITLCDLMLALLSVVLFIAGSPECDMLSHLEHCNPDLVILKTVYLDQGDPIQCCFEKRA